MSVEELRRELGRIAERAPELDVPDTTWARARRARRRDTGLAVLAGAATVALVVGLVAWIPARDSRGPASGGTGAVPDHVWLVPNRIARSTDQLESDLAIGTGAVAYITDAGVPVVVDADDGDYHLLNLPDFYSDLFQEDFGSPLALSPDGTHLAWGWADLPDSGGSVRATGVRIADLRTGDVRTIDVPLRRGHVMVSGFHWSPNGQWLAWDGMHSAVWNDGVRANGKATAGRVAPSSDEAERLPTLSGNAWVSYAISDTGDLTMLGDSEVVTFPVRGTHSTSRFSLGATFSSSAAYVDGVLVDVRGRDRGVRYTAYVHDPTSHRALPASYDFPRELEQRDVEVLGWVDGSHLLGRAMKYRDPQGADHDSELVLISLGEEPSYDVVGKVDAGVPPLSIATDLVAPDRPTVERPEPDWPWTIQRWVLTIGLSGACLALLGGAAWWWRRRLQARIRS